MDEPLYQHYNYDNVFNRSVIAGLLYLLNHKIKYPQVFEDNIVETVTVPFVYNTTSSKDNQDFLQDNYTFFGRECFSDKLIDGKFDMLPRFAITYSGSQINSSEITNRFVEGKYMKDENGKLQSYTAFLYSIPLTMNFEVEGWIDNIETAFKIEQELRATFYKNQTFKVLFRGMTIGCCVGFPEQVTQFEKTVSYSFEQDTQLKMSFNLAVECYQPCFDESMAIKSENVMESLGYDISLYNSGNTPKDKKVMLKLDPIDKSVMRRVGTVMDITWEHSVNLPDVATLFLYYITEDGDKHVIDTPLASDRKYKWTIPYNIVKYAQPDILFIDGDVSVVNNPTVNVRPNADGYVDTGSFDIMDGGDFSKDGYMQVSCEYVDDKGNLHIHDCYVAVIEDRKVKDILYFKDVPDQHYIINVEDKLKYDKGSHSSRISIGVMYPSRDKISDQIDNILII